MKTTTNKTRIIFLAVLASLISITYIFSQSKSEVITTGTDKAVLSSNHSTNAITGDTKHQKSNVENAALSQIKINNPNIEDDKQNQTMQSEMHKVSSNKVLAADALPPQPLPEGQEIKESRQHQTMPPPAPDSKYAVNHQHTNRPDIGAVEKH